MIPPATATSGSGAIRAFSPGQVALATFLGSPIAGGIVMCINERRAGRSGAVWVLAGLGLTALLFVVASALPSPANNLFAGLGIVAMLQLARMQEPKLGPSVKASAWGAVGVGVLSLAVILAGIVGYVVLDEPPSIAYGEHHEVQYTRGAAESEAKIVGDWLEANGMFASGQGATVRVGHDHGEVVVSFVVHDGAWDEADSIFAFTEIRRHIAELFPERVVVMQLCDDGFDVHRTIR